MTDLANLAVDFEAALQLSAIEFADRSGERPFLPRRRLLLGSERRSRGETQNRYGRKREGETRATRRGLIMASLLAQLLLAAAVAATGVRPPAFASTASEIECGSGNGFSIRPSSGSTTRKWMKYQAVRMRAAIT